MERETLSNAQAELFQTRVALNQLRAQLEHTRNDNRATTNDLNKVIARTPPKQSPTSTRPYPESTADSTHQDPPNPQSKADQLPAPIGQIYPARRWSAGRPVATFNWIGQPAGRTARLSSSIAGRRSAAPRGTEPRSTRRGGRVSWWTGSTGRSACCKPIVTANRRWPGTGIRVMTCSGLAGALRTACAEPAPLMARAEAAGDPIAVLLVPSICCDATT
jgi:hypothetical protein